MARRAQALVISLLVAQFVCVASVAVWYAGWQRQAWTAAEAERLSRISRSIVNHAVTALTPTRQPGDPHPPAIRPALDRYLADAAVPAGWCLTILDRTGRAVATTAQTPPPVGDIPGHWPLTQNDTTLPLSHRLQQRPAALITGEFRTDTERYDLAARRIPGTGYTVVARGLIASDCGSLATLAADLGQVGLAMGVVTILLTGLLTHYIIRRYHTHVGNVNKSLETKVFERTAALVQTREAVVFGLAKLAESRDQETGAHILRMQRLSALLANELRKTDHRLDAKWVECVRRAAALHDIGKVGIPDAILLKPGPLNQNERRMMQTHTTVGADCLEAIGDRLGTNDFLAMARDIATAHHEWWDGRGYPHGLRGEQIPLAARIVAVADVYDAASSARVYKAAQSHSRVRALIVGGAGTQFDPRVVAAFLAVEQEFHRVLTEPSPLTPAAAPMPMPHKPAENTDCLSPV
jgi:HD-GYP domain-containing protein (c-di-GMP phosphodiesterase class II)